MESYLKELNPQQVEAVLYSEGPLLVLAGAGSGKTRVLTYKYAYIMDRFSLSPEEILAVTFTNKAANEMKERILNLTGINPSRGWISTFHSFGVRVLRMFADRLGYPKSFVIYDDDDQIRFIKSLLKDELNLDEEIYHPKKVQYFINFWKNQGIEPHTLSFEDNKNFEVIYLTYQNKMRENNSMDFGDLLLLTCKLFREHEDVLSLFKNRFKFILVDEFQDTNRVQYEILKLLAGENGLITAVGDDDQSIFSWRGATVENIIHMERDFPSLKVVKLERNYRSTRVILEAANSVISKNSIRRPKKLWTEKKGGAKIKVKSFDNEYEEAFFVINEIKNLDEYSDTAILYRVNAQSRVFEDELVRNGIPYVVVGGFKFFDRKEIKDILAYLKIIDGYEDIINYRRIINTPSRKIGDKTFNKILSFSMKNRITFFEALSKIKDSHEGVKNFFELIKKFRELKDKISISELTERLYEESGYMKSFDNLSYVERENRVENLYEFLNSIRNFEKKNPSADLRSYLDSVSLMSSLDVEVDDNRVNLMTIHAAKGLEFKNVFIVGFENGLLPHINSMGNRREFEEERRLCYVAITRAKERLYITYCRRRARRKAIEKVVPSEFLKDIPKHLIEGAEDLYVGAIVFHDKFGEGEILAVIGKGDDKKVKVFFRNYGLKTLKVKHASLEVIG